MRRTCGEPIWIWMSKRRWGFSGREIIRLVITRVTVASPLRSARDTEAFSQPVDCQLHCTLFFLTRLSPVHPPFPLLHNPLFLPQGP